MITEYRQSFKPFEYPEFQRIYQHAKMTSWVETEAPMEQDYRDYMSMLEKERTVITGILNGFTLLETHISDYWADVIPKMFPKHEIVSMARLFSAQERLHADAYSHLSDTLGLEDIHDAFLGSEEVKAKLSAFANPERAGNVVSLGVFSGAGEGVSLFASFSVLYSFSLQGRLKGLRQIISWSILDEQIHSDAACRLFNIYDKEIGVRGEERDNIYEGFDLVLKNEDAFLDDIFQEDLDQITRESVWNFLRFRANNRLCKLGLQPIYSYNAEEAYKIREWFDPLSGGTVDQDFFASIKEGSGYNSRPEQKFDLSLLPTLNLNYA